MNSFDSPEPPRDETSQKKPALKSGPETADAIDTIEARREQWTRVIARMRQDLGDTVWRSWIRNLRLISTDNGVATIGAESKLTCNRVASQYSDRLRAHCQSEWDDVVDVKLELMRPTARMPEKPVRASEDDQRGQPLAAHDVPKLDSVQPIDAFYEIGGRIDPRMNFDNFIVDKSNNLAHAAAMRVAESPTTVYNPLFLHGGVGLGKTHLMHAIAGQMRQRFPNRRVVYLSAEVFMHRFIKALRHRNTTQFKEEFRSVDVLMVDDVQFIGGKNSTQEEFFHTFNALIDQNKQIIISADKSPTDLSGMEERLRSRLNWGMVADIHPTTYELRVGILQSKAEQEGIDIPQNVIEFLAHKITSNVRELEGALNRLFAFSTLVGKPITIDTIYDVLSDVLRASNRQISVGEIQRQVASHYNIRLDEMHSKRRSRNIVHPRQVAMYLAKHLTSSSYPEIGHQFGGRDHTTVMHAVGKIEKMMLEESVVVDDIKMLKSLLNAG
ncbi:MAG: chromosomal replication initiator protein DnaA [Alphaproteobacteria bacterium]|nr:chromosomal replication initiator protein DnaA [Alphaproteobacteria bacterium]